MRAPPRRPCARRAPPARQPRASATGTTGRSWRQRSPCATPHAMRTPVNDPGPAPNAMPSRSRSAQPASASTASHHAAGGDPNVSWPARSASRCEPRVAVAEGHAAPGRSRCRRPGRFIARFYRERTGWHAAPMRRASAVSALRRQNCRAALPQKARLEAMSSAPVVIESLDQEGRGVARVRRQGGVRRGRAARRATSRSRRSQAQAQLRARAGRRVHRASAGRASTPLCPHFGVCGGCSMQHLEAAAQVAAKQRALEDALWHIGRVRPDADAAADPWSGVGLSPSRPAVGPARGQKRRRAGRLPRAEVELRRRHARLSCPAAEDLAPASAAARSWWRAVDPRSPAADRAGGGRRCADHRRHAGRRAAPHPGAAGARPSERRATRPPCGHSPTGTACSSICSPAAPRPRSPFHPLGPELAYTLPEFGLVIPFAPTEFTQVNAAINRVLVRRTVALAGSAARRAHRGFLLRPRQLHPADRTARRRRGAASKAAPRCSTGQAQRRAQRARTRGPASRGGSFRGHARERWRRSARWTRH